MKSNLVKTILDWALVASLVLSIVLLFQFFMKTRELRSLQSTLTVEAQRLQMNRALLNALANDANEYSKRDPGMRHLLDSLRPATAPAAAPVVPPQPAAR